MQFPFEFTKSGGSYDFISPIINFTGNAAVVAVGGISLGAITYFALPALGFSSLSLHDVTVISVSIGAFGALGVLAGAVCLAGVYFMIVMALSNR
jgi:hypothetical protein